MNEKGFTLIELLIVLSIVSILLFITSTTTINITQKARTQHFLNTLKVDILYGQARAMEDYEVVSIYIDVINSQYKIYNSSFMIRRDIPNYVVFTNPAMTTWKYSPLGNVTRSGSIYFNVFNQPYKLTNLLGMGRFYVEKL